jgi:hypothetical protein
MRAKTIVSFAVLLVLLGLMTPAYAYEMSLPEGKWRLTVDLPGFVVEKEQELADNNGRMMKANNREVIISIFLIRNSKLHTPQACRQVYFNSALKTPLEKTDIRTYDTGSMAIGEYTIEKFQDAKIMQRHLNAYLVRDGINVDVHLSKTNFKPGDDKIFQTILNSVRFSKK